MKRTLHVLPALLPALFFTVAMVHAQEQTEVSVRIEKGGQVVQDTTIQFDNEADAMNALKMMEVLSGEGTGEMEFNYTMAHTGAHDGKAMVFISQDGETTHLHGDSLVWIEEEEGTDGPAKVMKYKIKKEDGSEGEHVVVVTSGDGETFDVLIDEEIEEGKPVVKEKRVKVVVKESEDGTVHITEEETISTDEEVIVITGEDSDEELKKVMEKVKSEEGEETEVKVIVIKKKEKSKQ